MKRALSRFVDSVKSGFAALFKRPCAFSDMSTQGREPHAHTLPKQIDDAEKALEGPANTLDATTSFDLLLFDLDDTLLKSGHLEKFRGKENVNNSSPQYLRDLKEAAAKDVSPLIPESILRQLRSAVPGLRLGVFTRAPREYARTLLDQFFPTVAWDCLVAFEDVEGKTKPAPDGVYLTAQKVGVSDFSRVAVVGDQAADIASAYQAGASAVLFTKAWGIAWKKDPAKNDHYQSRGFLPDAIIRSAGQLLNFVNRPQEFMPALETAEAVGCTVNFPNALREVDSRNHFNNLEGCKGKRPWVRVFILGRYFAVTPKGSRYDFLKRGDCHRVSQRLLRAKDGEPYPDSWVDCIDRYLKLRMRLIPGRQQVVVCSIPSSHATGMGSGRLNEFLGRVPSLVDGDDFVFDSGLLGFRDGVRSQKTLGLLERFENVRDHLVVAKRGDLAGAFVIVVDDIVTSGATFFYAYRYLKAAGAADVHCVALAQSIS